VLQNPVCRSRVALSRKPFEPFENNSKGIKKELLGSFEGLTWRFLVMKDLLKRRQLYGVDVQQLEDAQLDAVAGCSLVWKIVSSF
jgi:hypothetical protein